MIHAPVTIKLSADAYSFAEFQRALMRSILANEVAGEPDARPAIDGEFHREDELGSLPAP